MNRCSSSVAFHLLFFFLVGLSLGCPQVEGPLNQDPGQGSGEGNASGDGEPEDGDGSSDLEADSDSDNDTDGDGDGDSNQDPVYTEVALYLVADPLNSPAMASAIQGGPRFLQLELGVEKEVTLSAGVYSLYSGDSQNTAPFRALSGSFSLQNDEPFRFLIPREEILRVQWLSESDGLVQIQRESGGPGALIDEALQAGSDDVEVVLALQHRLREAMGNPIGEPQRYFFVGIGSEDGIAPELRGTFNDWAGGAAFALQPLQGRLWGRFVDQLEGFHEYKVVYGGGSGWFTDLGNPDIRWDGVPTSGLGAFNSVLNPLEGSVGEGRLLWWPRVESESLENYREVYVYLPPGFSPDDGGPDYDLLVFHDGNESITRGRFHEALDELSPGVIAAFVGLPSQEERLGEYTVGTDGSRGEPYGEFIATELLPLLEERFPLAQEREHRGVIGASLGGLISFWIAMEYPESFGFVGAMSSSFFWGEDYMLDLVAERGCQDLRFYIDSGSPQDNYEVTLAMRDLLSGLDCDFSHRVETGGLHQWGFWRGRLPGLLAHFLEDDE